MSQGKYLIIERDGYPLQIESVHTLNDGIQQSLSNIAAVCGSNTILTGCEDEVRSGVTYVTDGVMCIGGKVFQFIGGLKTLGVTIITDKVEDMYDTGDGSAIQILPVRGYSYVTNTPQGSANIGWNTFIRVSSLKEITQELEVFKQGLNTVKTEVQELRDSEIIKKDTRDIDLTGEDNWVTMNVLLPENNVYNYVISANVIVSKNNINDIQSQYSLTIFNKTTRSFSLYVKRLSGPGDQIIVDYLAVKY